MFSLAAEVVFILNLPYDLSTARICFCIQTWCLMQNMQNLWTLMGHDIVRPICICSLCVILIKNGWAQAGLFPSRSWYNDTDSQDLDKTVFVQGLVHPGPVGAKELLTTPGSIRGVWVEWGRGQCPLLSGWGTRLPLGLRTAWTQCPLAYRDCWVWPNSKGELCAKEEPGSLIPPRLMRWVRTIHGWTFGAEVFLGKNNQPVLLK